MGSHDLPFTEGYLSRTFSAAVDPNDLQWHWDEQDRLVCAEKETDWKIQYDNELPQDLKVGLVFYVRAGSWHRLIKGTGELRLTIIKDESHVQR